MELILINILLKTNPAMHYRVNLLDLHKKISPRWIGKQLSKMTEP